MARVQGIEVPVAFCDRLRSASTGHQHSLAMRICENVGPPMIFGILVFKDVEESMPLRIARVIKLLRRAHQSVGKVRLNRFPKVDQPRAAASGLCVGKSGTIQPWEAPAYSSVRYRVPASSIAVTRRSAIAGG